IYFFGCTSAELTTGKLAYQQRDYVKAEQELKKGLEIDKSNDEGWFMLGYSQIELGKFEEAKVSFKTALSISNKYADYIRNYWIDKYNAGISAFNAGTKSLGSKDSINADRNFRNALHYFKGATCITPDSISAFQIMGDCYTYLNKPDSALLIYTGILDKSKSKADAIMIAKILYMSGMKVREVDQWEKAIEIFTKATEIPYLPKDNTYFENSLFNIGFSHYQIATKIASENKGDFKPSLNEAIKVLEPLSTSSKDNTILTNTFEILYNAYDALGMPEKAQDALKKKQELQNKK
ncbi:MAG: tetratricopeptide repeat protein, partial [Ignavibacteria bacterium]